MPCGEWKQPSNYFLELTIGSCAIEMSMVVSHLVWLFRTRGIRKRAKKAGKTFDEFEEGIEWQSKGIDVGRLLKDMYTARNGAKGGASVSVDAIEALPKTEEVTPKTVPNAVV